MRILHVIRDLSLATGGPAVALAGMAQAQAALGCDVRIAGVERGGQVVEPGQVQVELAPSPGGSWGWAPALRRLLEPLAAEADILHLHMAWDYPVWLAARIARRLGKPYILRPCGQFAPWSISQKRLKKRLYLKALATPLLGADAFHFTSEGERAGAAPIAGDRRAFVIPNGLTALPEPEPGAGDPIADRFPQLAGRRVVLFLGRVHPKKQPEILIDAVAALAGAFPDLFLLIAGPGEADYVDGLKRRATAAGIAGRTLFAGTLGGAEVAAAYRAADVFALPSHQENFGNAIVEAMAAGCPVLVSDAVDLSAEIAGAGAGIVCPPRAPDVTEAIGRLLGDADARARLAGNGRRLVRRRFGWDGVARQLLDQYRDIAGGVD